MGRMADSIRHGTHAGYQQHKRQRVPICEECRAARREHERAYYAANREKINEQRRANYAANRETVAENRRAYYEDNREAMRERSRVYREANREEIAERNRAWYAANREEQLKKRREYYEANREKIAEKQKAYYDANRDELLANEKAWREANPEKLRDGWLVKKFGITAAEYDQMVMARCGSCDICGEPATPRKKSLAVDHDHDTGAVRGLLCSNCNTGIGNLRDDPELLNRAVAYLG